MFEKNQLLRNNNIQNKCVNYIKREPNLINNYDSALKCFPVPFTHSIWHMFNLNSLLDKVILSSSIIISYCHVELVWIIQLSCWTVQLNYVSLAATSRNMSTSITVIETNYGISVKEGKATQWSIHHGLSASRPGLGKYISYWNSLDGNLAYGFYVIHRCNRYFFTGDPSKGVCDVGDGPCYFLAWS